MSKSIEQAADEYQATATDVSGGLTPYHVDAFLAGAKHQKELSDAREKLLLNVIEMSQDYTRRVANISFSKSNSVVDMNLAIHYFEVGRELCLESLSSVAKKLEGL